MAGSSQNVYEGRASQGTSRGEEIGIWCEGMGKDSTSVDRPVLGIILFLSMTPNDVNVGDRPAPQFRYQALGMGLSLLKVTTVENRADISIAMALFGSLED